LGLEKCWASEAALSLATRIYNRRVLFQRHLGGQQKVTIHFAEILALRDRGRFKSSGRLNQDQTGGACPRTSMMVAVMGKDFESVT